MATVDLAQYVAMKERADKFRALLQRLVDADDYAERNNLDQILGAVTIAQEARALLKEEK